MRQNGGSVRTVEPWSVVGDDAEAHGDRNEGHSLSSCLTSANMAEPSTRSHAATLGFMTDWNVLPCAIFR